MNKEILKEYIDARELIKETEEDIRKLRKKKKSIVQDRVKGSMAEYPYAPKSFHLEGTQYSYMDDLRLRAEEELLVERKKRAEEIKTQAQAIINAAPLRMQRIIRYRLFEGLTWEEVADRMGCGATGDSTRMEYERFIKKV